MVTRLKPYNPSASELVPSWHVIDAKGKVLGRLATEISTRLMGKDRPGYVPHLLSGDFVIVINAAKVKITGQKSQTKVYRRHSQKPGNLKEIPYETVLEKFPERIIEHSVKGMLPKTKLGVRMLSRLKVYGGEEHPHSAQLIGSERRLSAIAAGELEAPKRKAPTRRRKPKQAAEEVAVASAAAPATGAPAEETQEPAEEAAPKTAAKKAPARKTTGSRKTAATKSTASKSTGAGARKAAAPKSSGTKSTATKSAGSKASAAKSSTSKSSTDKKASTSRPASSKSSASTASRRSTTKPTRSSSTRKSS